jgi:TldD protein
MQKISLIGADMAMDEGVGMCGKNGQSVVVGLGQPSLLISELTVGGAG